MAEDSELRRLPRTWRIPPYQPALLLLVVSGCAAVNLYWHPSLGLRVATIALAIACLVLAIAAIRFSLIADDDGIWVRHWRTEHGVLWGELADIEVLPTGRNGLTIRIVRQDGTFAEVPPSLLQPTLPTGVRRAQALVHGIAVQLRQCGPQPG